MFSKAIELIKNSKNIAVLTGAGISVASGIPDFRSPGGLWDRFDPFEYAHIDSFTNDPYKVWKMLKEMNNLVAEAQPNYTHIALKELENLGKKVTIITQNIDSLHSKAGSSNVYEYHGVWDKLLCIKCNRRDNMTNFPLDSVPICPICNFPYKPEIVFFGEPIDPDISNNSLYSVKNSDIFMVIGTSAQVYPAASLPQIAHSYSKPIIEINLETTPITHSLSTIYLKGKSEEIMKQIIDKIR